MEPSKEAIAVRITRLNRQILGKVTSGSHKLNKKTIDREALLDALTVLYDECNDDPVKKTDELVRAFVDKYRSTLAELRRTRVCLSDFEILQTIGRGHFGEVHMVREKETGDVYALKTLRKEQARKRAAGAAEDERDVLANATGPWMPRLQYAFQDSNSLYLVMELCSGGDLAGLLARRARPLAESDAAFYVAEVAHALKALHAMGYVHRDIKPHNIFLDRCGHVKLGDFGSCARLSEGGAASAAGGTPDYVAPELLAAADCAARHAVCLPYCRSVVTNAISACDYWSLGVVAFELVTLKRPFSNGEDDSIPEILANIQKYESSPDAEPPFEAAPAGPSRPWRALVAGLLRVAPARRYNYLDTLQHPALAGASGRMHSIRDLAPPWVPMLRGAEDSSYLGAPEREPPPPCAAPFRARHPFAGQLPFIGYSYVAPEENEDSSGGFNASHDCTAIDLATFKSAEKLAAMRGREVSSLQSKLAASEAAVGAAAERARREADAEAERTRARLQAEITALSLQNRRLERQVEVEKEERMALQRTNQELTSGAADRASSEVRAARAHASSVEAERDALRDDLRRLEARVGEVQAECARAVAAADAARAQHQHYKDSVAKERALRRQTLSGCENESRELTTRAAAAEANAAREARARTHAERRFADLEDEHGALTAEHAAVRAELDEARAELKTIKASAEDQQHALELATEQMKQAQQQLAQERVRNSSLTAQVQELQRGLEEAARRETALEEQSTRTEARLNERLHTADARLTAALADEARHREKVNTLEQLVRQLEREVGALESRGCVSCAARAEETTDPADRNRGDSASDRGRGDSASDTESVADAAHAQLALLKEQLERAEGQLQSRAEEIATLRQEARSANLARWRKEREYNDLSVEAKSNARDLKRLEERLSHAVEARKTAEQKANALQEEVVVLKPKYEQANATVETLSGQLERLRKAYETAQAEVDRSRNDIRKLKSELQYSEKRRLHAEQQEEMSSRELQALRVQNTDLVQNNKALQEACGLLEEQLTDLEKLADIHEIKNKDLESETQRLRTELETCRGRLVEAEKQASERGAAASIAAQHHDEARETARHAHCQLQLLRERLENREARVAELESRVASLEGSASGTEAALGAALRRVRELQEESSALRTRAHEHHAHALALQAGLADAQEELSAAREAAEAAAAWWRTRETKADATLRQQAKLIDFLQAKVEEAGRKKCSLSNKLFGRSGRRSAASPPLRRVNRELREEVERLRAQLASRNGEPEYPPTPRREKPKAAVASRKSIDMPDGSQDNNSVQIIWSDGVRERVRARMSEAGEVLLSVGDATMRARLLAPDAHNLPQNEANRAFAIKLECPARCDRAAVVCSSIEERNSWLQRLRAAAAAAAPAGYAPHSLGLLEAEPAAALYVAPNAVAIGCEDGLHSLRGPIRLELEGECDVSPARVTGLAAGAGRALIIRGGMLLHVSLLTLGSALRRSSNLKPTVTVARVQLQDDAPPHLIRPLCGSSPPCIEGLCAAVACGGRVSVLRYDAAAGRVRAARGVGCGRARDLLLAPRALLLAAERPLRLPLPAGALEAFAQDDPLVAAAARQHSPPKAILLIKEEPMEILICYAECGVFLDDSGRRTRSEEARWGAAVRAAEYVAPFLYLASAARLSVLHVGDDAYRPPPCTCPHDAASLASTTSDYSPRTFHLKLDDPVLLGTAPTGVIVASRTGDGRRVSLVEGLAAFRSVGASVESLETIADSKGSSADLAQSPSPPELSPPRAHDASQESVEAATGFLADIRKRARQLRAKQRKERTPDDVIKEILTAEVGLKRSSGGGRRSPATGSEFDSDSTESEDKTDSKGTSDLCAEMFTRQVRFQ